MLVGTNRAEVEWIECQDNVFSLQVAELVIFIIIASECEIWCWLAYPDRHDYSLLYRHMTSSCGNPCCAFLHFHPDPHSLRRRARYFVYAVCVSIVTKAAQTRWWGMCV